MASFDHAKFYIKLQCYEAMQLCMQQRELQTLAGIGSRLVITRIASVSQLVVAAV